MQKYYIELRWALIVYKNEKGKLIELLKYYMVTAF